MAAPRHPRWLALFLLLVLSGPPLLAEARSSPPLEPIGREAAGVKVVPAPVRGHLIMISDEGDFIGLGGNFHLKQPPWTVVVEVVPWDQSVAVDFFPPDWPVDTGKWFLRFSMPGGGRLQEGFHDDVSRWLAAPASDARMWIAGEHRGCNRISGWFWVRRAEYDDAGTPTHLDITFQQYCEFETEAALSGRLRWGRPGARDPHR